MERFLSDYRPANKNLATLVSHLYPQRYMQHVAKSVHTRFKDKLQILGVIETLSRLQINNLDLATRPMFFLSTIPRIFNLV